MQSSQREDFLMRHARAVAAILARLAGLRVAGDVEEWRTALEQAYGDLLGKHATLVRQVDVATAARMLGQPEAIAALAQLTREEAAAAESAEARAALEQRAAELEAQAARRHT